MYTIPEPNEYRSKMCTRNNVNVRAKCVSDVPKHKVCRNKSRAKYSATKCMSEQNVYRKNLISEENNCHHKNVY
jgi:hypothetical protein